MTARRRGFTLVEILVVLGIIIVLIGIGSLAYQKIDKVTGDRATRTNLETLNSMLAAYELEAGLGTLEAPYTNYPTNTLYSSIYVDTTATNGTTTLASIQCSAPATAGSHSWSSNEIVAFGSNRRYDSSQSNASASANTAVSSLPAPTAGNVFPAPPTYLTSFAPPASSRDGIFNSAHLWPVWRTGLVLRTFKNIGSVTTVMSQLPSDQFLPDPSRANQMWTDKVAETVSGQEQVLPVVLDAWKNPIIFVPMGGLTNVFVGGPLPITTTGSNAYTVASPAKVYTVTSMDGRPFWASAGPDGDFSTGDDNVYSCPVQLGTPPSGTTTP